MTDYPLVGVVTWPVFKFCPNNIFGIGEAGHFKFRVLTNTDEYSCMHDILLPKRDVFRGMLQLKDNNISLTVQDRGMVAMEH